jgi:hypothetical protein
LMEEAQADVDFDSLENDSEVQAVEAGEMI